MLKALRTAVLLLTLACTAQAGEMLSPPVAPPPPQTAQEATPNGQMEIPPLVQIVLSLLALF